MTVSPVLPRIAVFGRGRLGGTLAAALTCAGYEVTTASARDRVEAQRALDTADLAFLTVPDAAISEVAASLTWRPQQAAVHCSGALGLDALAPAAEVGASVGCFHPLQPFPAGDPDPARFHGITCGIEAAPPLAATLEVIAHRLGAHVVRLEGVDRARYHAAAVFASNDVVALMAAAMRAWTLAGLPPTAAREALSTLLAAAAGSLRTREPIEALTGPVARGDVATVRRNLAALEADPDLHLLYRRLGAELLRLPLQHTPEVAAELRALLDSPATSDSTEA